MRDHSWGVRDWQGVPYWRWFGMVVDPDNFLVRQQRRQRRDGGETAGGFMMRDGELAPIVACETQSELDPELGCQRSFDARRRTDSAGRADGAARPGDRGRAAAPAPRRPPHAGERGADRVRLGRHGGTSASRSTWFSSRRTGDAACDRAERDAPMSATAPAELLQRLIRFDTTNPPGERGGVHRATSRAARATPGIETGRSRGSPGGRTCRAPAGPRSGAAAAAVRARRRRHHRGPAAGASPRSRARSSTATSGAAARST